MTGSRPQALRLADAPAKNKMDDEELEHAKKLVGTALNGKYRLDAVLGIGGMGVVYRGQHRNGNRVAVKTLHTHLAIRSDVRTRFLKEGYTANAVEHEGVVRVLDDDVTADGLAFLVMDLLQGETLDGRWERSGRRLPPAAVLDASYQLLDVLASAHEKGIIHRDLKPENLFMTKGDVVKVLDFGIARVQHDVNMHMKTKTGTLLGTPAFMPPEQALGRVSEIDGRTDLWAVGATMFTLLSGAYVHPADNMEMLRIMAAMQPARKLAAVAPNIPAEIASLVDRALAFDMSARFSSAREMQAAVVSAHKAVFGMPPASARDAKDVPVSLAATDAGPAPAQLEPVLRPDLISDTTESPAHGGPERTRAMASRPLPPGKVADAVSAVPSVKKVSTTAGVSRAEEPEVSRTAPARRVLAFTLLGASLFLIVGGGLLARSRWSPKGTDGVEHPEASSIRVESVPSTDVHGSSAAVLDGHPSGVPSVVPTVSATGPAAVAMAATPSGAASLSSPSRAVAVAPRTGSPKSGGSATAVVASSPSAASPLPPPKPSCDPNYTIDAAGHRILKRECL
jgi:serine/threonine-protein kinase